ncbi:MAG: DHHA1 domain-containing protein [Candidatus Woesearchaeota archaeon]
MLTQQEMDTFKDVLVTCKRPLIYFDDDADGLSSFLLFYRFLKRHCEDVKGIVVKSAPELKDEMFLRKIDEFSPDIVIVLDKPMMSQDFIDAIKVPVYWLDHHPPQTQKNVHYFNPLLHSDKDHVPDNRPTTYLAYRILGDDAKEDLWIAMIGCTGDWFIPEFAKGFSEQYPYLLPSNLKIRNPGTLLFETEIGKLAHIFQYTMKGSMKDTMSCVKILTRIKDPYEILEGKTPSGKFILKHYQTIRAIYERIRATVKVTRSPLISFLYEDQHSMTGEISNELNYFYPKKFILIARKKGDRMMCSLRAEKFMVRNILEKALMGIDGTGGGHEHACGASISEGDFDKFLNAIKKQLKTK